MIARVDVQLAADDESVPAVDDIALWVNRTLNAASASSASEISVRVVDVIEMQRLNKDFRDQDKPTNVLSFAAGDLDGLPDDVQPLGDIVVCAAVVAGEAEQQNKPVGEHWAHMIVHGTLHLLGFDHESDSDAAEMEGLEIQIMADHGIADPYRESPAEN